MTTKAQLTQLAERVMALSGPDREVDAAIWLWRAAPEWDNPLSPEEQMQWAREAAKPAFTASLDAAMSLAPDRNRAGVLYHAMEEIKRTGFPGCTFLQKLICNVAAQALLARAAECGE